MKSKSIENATQTTLPAQTRILRSTKTRPEYNFFNSDLAYYHLIYQLI